MAKIDKHDATAEEQIDDTISIAKAAPAPKLPQPSTVLRAQLERGREQGRSKNVGRLIR